MCRLGDLFQVRVSAGTDPATGERIVLTGSVRVARPGNARCERAAANDADKLQAEADSLKVARTKDTLPTPGAY